MIVVRDIFHLKFGKAKEAKALMAEAMDIMKKFGFTPGRLLTDLTGKSYRLIMESEVESLSELEAILKKAFGNEEWEKWYQKFIPLVESGEREMLSVVNLK